MILHRFVVLITFVVIYRQYIEARSFWHVTDFHWDPTYAPSYPGVSCGGSGNGFVDLYRDDEVRSRLRYGYERSENKFGKYGDYRCDSPFALINSSVYAMANIKSDVDFLIWTGDDTPHNIVQSRDDVLATIKNLTDLLTYHFPRTPIFPVLGNHDWSPKNQLPPYRDVMYRQIAEIWKPWLIGDGVFEKCSECSYYNSSLNEYLMIVGLNTNLYYKSNNKTIGHDDPCFQFQWLERTLDYSKSKNLKVILIGHIPPGKFEKHPDYHWFQPKYNRRFLEIILRYADVLGSMHFAHHHTDSFRIVKDRSGATKSSLFLAPSVTPWRTTLPGVTGEGANNPAIRLVHYGDADGRVQNVLQYYLNLTEANSGNDAWKLEYDGQKLYDKPDLSSNSLSEIAEELLTDDATFSKYISMNSVLLDDRREIPREERIVHYCAITEIDYYSYEKCILKNASGVIVLHHFTTTFTTLLLYVLLYLIL